MAKYKVDMIGEDGEVIETLDPVFDNEDDAQEAAYQWLSDYAAGGDVLKLMGEEYGEEDIEFDIYKVK